MPTVTSSEKLFLSCFLLLLLVRLLSYFCTATQLHFPPDCMCVCECVWVIQLLRLHLLLPVGQEDKLGKSSSDNWAYALCATNKTKLATKSG